MRCISIAMYTQTYIRSFRSESSWDAISGRTAKAVEANGRPRLIGRRGPIMDAPGRPIIGDTRTRKPQASHFLSPRGMRALYKSDVPYMYARVYTFIFIYACLVAPRAQQVLPTPQRFGSPRADHQEFWLEAAASNSNANR